MLYQSLVFGTSRRSTFLGLPPELRLEIYEHVIATLPYSIEYEPATLDKFGFALIHISRCTRQEALPVFMGYIRRKMGRYTWFSTHQTRHFAVPRLFACGTLVTRARLEQIGLDFMTRCEQRYLCFARFYEAWGDLDNSAYWGRLLKSAAGRRFEAIRTQLVPRDFHLLCHNNPSTCSHIGLAFFVPPPYDRPIEHTGLENPTSPRPFRRSKLLTVEDLDRAFADVVKMNTLEILQIERSTRATSNAPPMTNTPDPADSTTAETLENSESETTGLRRLRPSTMRQRRRRIPLEVSMVSKRPR